MSRKIVRQATQEGMTLSEYIKSKKLKLVDPTARDLQKVSEGRRSSAVSSSKFIQSAYTPSTQKWYNKSGLVEEDKHESRHLTPKYDNRVFSKPVRANKLRKSSTQQLEDEYEQDLNMKTSRKLLKRSGTLDIVAEKLKKLANSNQSFEEEEEQTTRKKFKWRCLNLNEWNALIFFSILTLIGIILSIIEFSYYADSI